MTRIRRLFGSGIVRFVLIAGILAFTLSGIPKAFEVYLVEVVVEEAESPDQVRLSAKGANMYRVNSIYLNGNRIKGADVQRLTYDQCYAILDRSLFKEGQWYRIELGFHKWGVINLLSSPVWLEWTY